VSRPLVHAYLGDRRGLVDAVQVRIIERLDRWIDTRTGRASTPTGQLRELIAGLLSFADRENDAWGVLAASGGLDHPALHQLRIRWVDALIDGDERRRLGAQAAVAALVAESGGWTARGVDHLAVEKVLAPLLAVDARRSGEDRLDLG
jgi:AcrR family transcriptional regulator